MDNRISLYATQYGKCAVTSTHLEKDDIHCHHKIPRSNGGTDRFENLVIIHKDIHRLIHAVNSETIEKYRSKLNLTVEQFYAMQREGMFASTTQIRPDKYKEAFEPYLQKGKNILYLGFSSGMSGTVSSASLCAR